MDIPNNIKVRIRKEHGSDIPLGFVTFYDMVTKKLRKDKSWNAWGDSELGEFSNSPKSGFTLVDHEARNSGFNSSRTLFRIKHPDGFLFEIEIENFFDIIKADTIEKGCFQGKYVLAWTGTTLILVSAESETYKTNTELRTIVDSGFVRTFEIGKAYKSKDGKFIGYYAGQRTVAVIKYSEDTPNFDNLYRTSEYPFNVKITLREVHIFYSGIFNGHSEYDKLHDVLIDGKILKISTNYNCWATPKVYACTEEDIKEIAKTHIFQPDALEDFDFFNGAYFKNTAYYKLEYQLIKRSVTNQYFIDLVTKTFPKNIKMNIEYNRAAYSYLDSDQPSLTNHLIVKP